MSWTGDALRDWERHDAQQQAALDKLPKCAYCDEPIQDDCYFEINGECVCEDCLNEHHRKWTEDYIQ